MLDRPRPHEPDEAEPLPRRVRALFLSDVHLGARACQADLLLDFLRYHDAERIYLVGDIVDGWKLRRTWYWPQSHNDVVQKLLRKGRKGAEIVYLPGNHDEFLRDYLDGQFGSVLVLDRAVHEALDGRRYLVLHGDQFDLVVRNMRWLAFFGDKAYDLAIWANTWLNALRRRFGFGYWSLSAWAKSKVKNAVNFIGAFEDVLSEAARSAGADGVICGHIHHAVIRDIGRCRYINTGDWVESCTAIVETHEGRFELIRWTKRTGSEWDSDVLGQAAMLRTVLDVA
ncbi:UDP-2,3-diacylglucosamine diphosphatase [Prosthecomicrobium sp. N25]|uniref:UDP-2,3-diacylglucosamine diphosphatase n=1 Tax=Prosthecomicrobium sp. N25 TaxID=3129254 RepID=UPI003077AA67